MMNTTTGPNEELEDDLINLESKILIWVLCAVCALTSIVGGLGNGFVLYFAPPLGLFNLLRHLQGSQEIGLIITSEGLLTL